MIRPILKYGDGHLHEPAHEVPEVTSEIQRLVDDMVETMYAAPGIGLAATQIGMPVRIFVVDLTVGRDPEGLIVMINPVFVDRTGMQLEEEGCLSVPGFNATVARPARAVVRGSDRGGVEREVAATGLLARAFQHEMDHLDGKVFLDRLQGIKKQMIVRRIKKLMRSHQW